MHHTPPTTSVKILFPVMTVYNISLIGVFARSVTLRTTRPSIIFRVRLWTFGTSQTLQTSSFFTEASPYTALTTSIVSLELLSNLTKNYKRAILEIYKSMTIWKSIALSEIQENLLSDLVHYKAQKTVSYIQGLLNSRTKF